MRECYNLNENYSIQEMEEIGEIFYQRLIRIRDFMDTTSDESKKAKAFRIFFRLYFTVINMTNEIAIAHQPKPSKHFKEGGVVATLRR